MSAADILLSEAEWLERALSRGVSHNSPDFALGFSAAANWVRYHGEYPDSILERDASLLSGLLWLAHTKRLQVEVFGGDPSLLAGEERTEFVRRMVLGAIKELTEALDEVGWKWWSRKDHFNRAKFIEELVDASHFIGALAVMAGCTDQEWEAAYLKKSAVNAARQEEGY